MHEEDESNHKKILIFSSIAFVFALIVLLLIFYLVQIYPVNQVSQFGINNVSEKADLINKYRMTSIQLLATFAQILGGVAIGFGIYFAWKNIKVAQDTLATNQKNAQDNLKLAQDTLESSMKNAQENLKVAQEGQITERFTRAVDQLGAIDTDGNPAIEIRLGGIYALDRISRESNQDYWSIMEIFTAYVRKNSPYKVQYLDVKDDENDECRKMNQFEYCDYIEEEKLQLESNYYHRVLDLKKLIGVSIDVEAILSVIEERRFSYFGYNYPNSQRNKEPHNLQLYGTNLQLIDLSKAHLEAASFAVSSLLGSEFLNSYLQEAVFSESKLIDARFDGANLIKADFEKACLKRASLSNTNLEKANLERANFKGAILDGANLKEANLLEAENLTIEQLSKVKTLYKAKLAEELKIPLKEKYPALFDKPKE